MKIAYCMLRFFVPYRYNAIIDNWQACEWIVRCAHPDNCWIFFGETNKGKINFAHYYATHRHNSVKLTLCILCTLNVSYTLNFQTISLYKNMQFQCPRHTKYSKCIIWMLRTCTMYRLQSVVRKQKFFRCVVVVLVDIAWWKRKLEKDNIH